MGELVLGWNCRAMLAAEREQRRGMALEMRITQWNRRSMQAAERWQNLALLRERKLEHRNRRALALEDRLSRTWRDGGEVRKARLLCSLKVLLERWQRREARERAAEVRRQHHAKRAAVAAQREKRKRLEVERKIRWKHMTRRDLPMADLLENATSV